MRIVGRVLAALGGIGVLGLGCESATAPPLIANAGLAFTARPSEQDAFNVWLAKADASGAVRLTDAVTFPGSFDPNWSADGSSLAFATQFSNDSAVIETVTAEGSDRTVVITGLTYSINPAWSPNGDSIVFAGRVGPGLGANDTYIAARDGSGLRVLAPPGNADADPEWSPDGSTIVFTSLRSIGGSSSTRGLYLMNPDGTNVRRVTLTGFSGFPLRPRWSPDGTRIAFEGLVGGLDRSDLFVYTPATGQLQQITSGTDSDGDPSWTPDGQRIAFKRGTRLYSIKADGIDLQQITFDNMLYSAPAYRP